MLNHFRTILRNSQQLSTSGVCTAYVPPEYVCKRLSGGVQKAHALLFGRAPDACKLDYRLWELLTLIAGTSLQSHVFVHDSRITYNLRVRPVDGRDFGAIVTFRDPDTVVDIVMSGDPPVESSSGALEYWWKFNLTDTVNLAVTQRMPQQRAHSTELVVTNGVAAPYTIPGTTWTHTYSQLVATCAWDVVYRAWPKQTLAEIYTALVAQLSVAEEFDIFKHSPVSVHNIWKTHPDIGHKLAALCVALVDAIPQGA